MIDIVALQRLMAGEKGKQSAASIGANAVCRSGLRRRLRNASSAGGAAWGQGAAFKWACKVCCDKQAWEPFPIASALRSHQPPLLGVKRKATVSL